MCNSHHTTDRTTLLQSVQQHIIKHNVLPAQATVVLGLSGGPDSVFLFYVLLDLHKRGYINLITAHLDHEWRASSAEDALFCTELAQRYGITIVVKKMSDIAQGLVWNGSKEEFARNARRLFFEQVAQQHDSQHIALAHHAQDQQETFFIRLLRGAKIGGLVGMRTRQGMYVRPLLNTKKTDIFEYLITNELPYVIDESNLSHDFLRNRIRHTVLPALEACDTRFENNFTRLLQDLESTEQFLQDLTKESYALIAKDSQNNIETIDLQKLWSLNSFLQPRVIIHWLRQAHIEFPLHEKFIAEIMRFLQNPGNNTHQIHISWKIHKHNNCAWITQ